MSSFAKLSDSLLFGFVSFSIAFSYILLSNVTSCELLDILFLCNIPKDVFSSLFIRSLHLFILMSSTFNLYKNNENISLQTIRDQRFKKMSSEHLSIDFKDAPSYFVVSIVVRFLDIF